MRIERFVRPLVACTAILLSVGMSLTVAGPNAGAEPGTHSELIDVTTGEQKGHLVIAPDARDREGEFHAEVTVNVHDLEPNTTYHRFSILSCQRAATPNRTRSMLQTAHSACSDQTVKTSGGRVSTTA